MVSGSLSHSEGGESEDKSAPPHTYTQRFYEAFPYYLAIGMTPEQYWDGDPELVKYYRKAEEIRNEKRNQELWLQGMYIYEALCDASPIFHAFAKKGVKPRPYSAAPYALTSKEQKKEKEAREKAISSKGKRYMETLMASTNKKFGITSTEV